jgi:cytochrome c553
MQEHTKIIVVTASLAISSSSLAAGDAALGKAKSIVCSACHGPTGVSANPQWPKLAGQHASYLAKALKDFRRGVRKDPTMSAMAKPLSDQDIENLAAYYASQAPR